MTTIREQILSLVPRLESRHYPEVIGALKQVGIGAKEDTNNDDWLLDGLARYLSHKGLIVSGYKGLNDLRRRNAYKTYLQKRASVIPYLLALERQSNTTRHRLQLAWLCARALTDLMDDWDAFKKYPVSMTLTQIDRIPEALTRAYPGYKEAGLYRFVLRQLEPTEG